MIKNSNKKIYLAGHKGLVGSSIFRSLNEIGYINVITRTHEELDLTNQSMVRDFFFDERPEEVYLAAAKVGGISANNSFPANFIYENLMIEANVIHYAFLSGVKKLLYVGSNCMYPGALIDPMTENLLLSGPLEPTNEPYAIAKIAGVKLCESYNRQYSSTHGIDFRSVVPTNLYGPGDNFHPKNSHVIPALIRRFHEAKFGGINEVIIWGSGIPKREFLYVDDMAKASIFVMEVGGDVYQSNTRPMQSHINIGFGLDYSIAQLADIVAKVVGYQGQIKFDRSMPDGSPRKLLDSTLLLGLGWEPKVSLIEGIGLTYEYFLSNGTDRM